MLVRDTQEELQQRQEESRRGNKMMKSRSPTRFLRRRLSPTGRGGTGGSGTGSKRSLTRNLPSHLMSSHQPQRGSAPTPSITNNPPGSRSNSRSKRKKGTAKSGGGKQSHMRARSPPVASLSDRLGRQRRRHQHKRSASSQMMLTFSQV